MKYLGNIPDFNIIHSTADRYDYVNTSNPAADTNPSTLYATWLNTSTGELFICNDNTSNANVWRGSLDTIVTNKSNNLVFRLDKIYQKIFTDKSTTDTAGTLTTGAVSATGQNDTPCLYFDGASHAIVEDDIPTVVGQITMAAWIYHKSQTDYWRAIFYKRTDDDADWGFAINKGDKMLTTYNDNTQTTSGSILIPDDTWLHVGISIDSSGNTTFYRDGVKYDTKSGATAINTASRPFLIGRNSTSRSEYFKGYIQDPVVYNTALTEAEMLLLYSRGFV